MKRLFISILFLFALCAAGAEKTVTEKPTESMPVHKCKDFYYRVSLADNFLIIDFGKDEKLEKEVYRVFPRSNLGIALTIMALNDNSTFMSVLDDFYSGLENSTVKKQIAFPDWCEKLTVFDYLM